MESPQLASLLLIFANSNDGTMAQPTTGEFKNGRSEFIDQETFKGRSILVRNIWSGIAANSWLSGQAFSDDRGKTWEVNWIAIGIRTKDESEGTH